MTDATVPDRETVRKPSKLPMITGIVLALAGGGGGFFAVSSGLLFGSDGENCTATLLMKARDIEGGDFGGSGGRA